jgi:hypothetical protein
LLKYRYEHSRKEILPTVWYYLLDAFTKRFHVSTILPLLYYPNRDNSMMGRNLFGSTESKHPISYHRMDFVFLL